MPDLDNARTLIDRARDAVVGDRDAVEAVDRCARRLDEPIRIALAGSLKAGKSTLLNALVGQDIAPTDTTECTRVVTWYRRGQAASVTAHVDDGTVAAIPVTRNRGRLGFDFGALTAERVDHLDVEWPSRALQSRTIVDTPGTASLSTELSASTIRLLAPEDGQSGVDAVVYLMRTLSAADTGMLRRISSAIGGGSGPLGVIGVVSRADEHGAGRMDAMMSAEQIAGRYGAELSRAGLCQAVVPVAGLLALGARTMREAEFRAMTELAGLPAADLEAALLTVDRFVRPDVLPHIDPAIRSALADRFGVFGIRMGVTLIRFGTTTSTRLADELVARSGLSELSAIIDVQFGQRADQLKAHSVLVTLDHVLSRAGGTDAEAVRASVRRSLADVHGFRELRLLNLLRSGGVDLPADQAEDLARIVGGHGVDPATRLGLDPGTDPCVVRSAAVDAAHLWRSRAAHPLLSADASAACATAVRSAEGIVAQLDAMSYRADVSM
ncbi:dynamin family protein [Gordonia sp. OPL2]|uniref:dynamin family protein n=1 Tax=Gordonia sp. OPL2 TaxID=2486274 RepID=UPI0016560EC2|nr:dynamin family protein [Gordonia sp. OPL2]ROZ99128.1 Isoniazid-inducible protein iniC [Gordonia sp. OPL2]